MVAFCSLSSYFGLTWALDVRVFMKVFWSSCWVKDS